MTKKESTLKIRADRATLADAVTWVSHATPKKPNAPALSGLKISAEAEAVTLSAFDYEVAHSAVVACDVPSAGECLVSAHLLREILSALKGKDVELALDASRLTVTSGRSEYRLGVMTLGDYPSLPAFPAQVGKVASADLGAAIAVVEHAVSRDKMIPVITCVHLDADGLGSLEAQATDRFRMAVGVTAYEGEPFAVNVPATSLTDALKGLSGPLDVGQEGGLFGLSDGSRTVTTRTVDDEFPPFTKHFQIEPQVTVDVDGDALAAALKRADLVNERNVSTALAFTADEVAITAADDSDEAVEFIECEASGDVEAHFNAPYLADALRAIGGPVRLSFTTATRPVIITPADEDRRARMLVMPRKALR